MKNKTFLQSIKCAIVGFQKAYVTEKNFFYYTGIALFFFVLNVILGSNLTEYALFSITVSSVFGAEFCNTAIEHICNFIHEDYNDKIKITKDISAGAVLAFGLGFFAVQGIVLIPKLL